MNNKNYFNKNYLKKFLAFRIFVGLLLLLGIILTGWLILQYNPSLAKERPVYMSCAFYELTGLYCPGCGGTRAVYELLNLRILNALHNNAMTILFILPLVAYLIFREYLFYLTGKEVLPFLRVKTWMIVAFSIISMLYFVLRNISIYPFTILAPIS